MIKTTPTQTPEAKERMYQTGPGAQFTQPATVRAPTGTVFTLDGDLVASGAKMLDQAFNSRSFERLRMYYEHVNSGDPVARQSGLSVLFGVATRAANLLKCFEEQGHVRFTGADLPTSEDLVYSAKTSVQRFIAQSNQITSALAKVMEAAPGLKLLSGEAAKRETEAPPPMKVEIVGMPQRVTEVSVHRDQAGDVQSSVQVERDL